MMRRVVVAFLVFACVASLVGVGGVKAQSVSTIFINANGSVSGTDANSITYHGNDYALTKNLYNTSIVVLCNNITLDGGGFTVQGPDGWPTPAGINLTCTGTTVQNFVVEYWEVGILGVDDGNTIYNNSVIGNERGIAIYADNYIVDGNYIARGDYCVRVIGNNDTFTQNNIDEWGYAFWISDSSGILITENSITSHNPMVFDSDYGGFQVYHNNFYNLGYNMGKCTTVLETYQNATQDELLPWDNGYPSGGNYWSDYMTWYPNATELGDSGIGDTPYNVTSSEFNPNLLVQDRYPLMSPVTIPNLPSAPNLQPQPTASPTPSPAPTSSPSPTTAATSVSTPKPALQNESAPIIGAVIAVAVAVGLAVFLILKRNRANSHLGQ